MEALDKGVVQEEHDGSKPPRPFLAPEDDLSDIADVLDFGMAETEFPARESAKS
jgi:hypothetical protein